MLANHEITFWSKKSHPVMFKLSWNPALRGHNAQGGWHSLHLWCCESRRGVKYQTNSTEPAWDSSANGRLRDLRFSGLTVNHRIFLIHPRSKNCPSEIYKLGKSLQSFLASGWDITTQTLPGQSALFKSHKTQHIFLSRDTVDLEATLLQVCLEIRCSRSQSENKTIQNTHLVGNSQKRGPENNTHTSYS